MVGSITYREDEDVWYAHALGSAGRWLGVEVADGYLSIVLWNEVVVPVEEPKRTLEVFGVKMRRTEKGRASYQATGTTRTGGSGISEYHDYASSDGRRFAMERYDNGGWETSVGETLSPADVVVLEREPETWPVAQPTTQPTMQPSTQPTTRPGHVGSDG